MKNYKQLHKLIFNFPASRNRPQDLQVLFSGAYLLESYCRQNQDLSQVYSLSDCGILYNGSSIELEKRLGETVGLSQISNLLSNIYFDHTGEYSFEDVVVSSAILHFMNRFEFPAFLDKKEKKNMFFMEFPRLDFDTASDVLRAINSKTYELGQNSYSNDVEEQTK